MSGTNAWKLVPKAKRIVVKIGSSTLTRDGLLRPHKFTALARDVSRLAESGRQVVLVSSGAIAVGALLLALWDRFRGPAPVSPAI